MSAPEHILSEACRILDAEARRLLAEQMAAAEKSGQPDSKHANKNEEES